MTEDLLAEAIRYLQQSGFSVIPSASDKTPCLQQWKDFQRRHPTVHEVTEWFSRPGVAGIAVVTGVISQVVVLDIDDEEIFARYVGKPLPTTPTALTALHGESYQ